MKHLPMVSQKLYLSAFAGLGCITNEFKMPRARSSHCFAQAPGGWSPSVDLHSPRPRLAESVTFQDTHPPGWGPGAGELVWGGWVGSVSARSELPQTQLGLQGHTLDPGTSHTGENHHAPTHTPWLLADAFPSWGHIPANCFCLIGGIRPVFSTPVFLVMLPLLCLRRFLSKNTLFDIGLRGWKKEVRKQGPSLFLPPTSTPLPTHPLPTHLTFYRSVCPAEKGLMLEGWLFPDSSLK